MPDDFPGCGSQIMASERNLRKLAEDRIFWKNRIHMRQVPELELVGGQWVSNCAWHLMGGDRWGPFRQQKLGIVVCIGGLDDFESRRYAVGAGR